MGRSVRIFAGVFAALVAFSAFASATNAHPYGNGVHCRTFVVRTSYGSERKLFCRDRYSGWREQSAPPAYYSQSRQSYGGPNYNDNRWRRREQPEPQEQNPPPATEQDDTGTTVDNTSPAQSDLGQAIDKLVAVDSRSWVWNSYDTGSAYDAYVEQLGSDGNASSVFGRYTFNGGSQGWVRVRMNGGKLSCIEFWDFKGTCRALGHSPSQAIAAVTVAVGAVAVAAAASSGHGSGGTTTSGGSSQPYYEPRRDNNNPPPPEQEPDQQRSYGLYGNCPAPGAGYGC